MPLFIASLNSGSNGNCYYIGNGKEAVLIDAGISCRETERRMQRLNLDISLVKAIFISHEHSDHITGISRLSKKYQLPVYITSSTLEAGGIIVEEHLTRSFDASNEVTIGNLSVIAFQKSHDACDPHSFIVSDKKVNIGIFTDIGLACKRVIHHFKQCHAVFLESNYCEDMLAKGDYPYYLKRRISGDNGHLSNTQALELFRKHRHPSLTHLILAHLSENNNDPALVERLFTKEAGQTKIVVASRYAETAVFSIGEGIRPLYSKTKKAGNQYQLSLFDA